MLVIGKLRYIRREAYEHIYAEFVFPDGSINIYRYWPNRNFLGDQMGYCLHIAKEAREEIIFAILQGLASQEVA